MADRKVFRFTNELNLTTTVKLIDAFVEKSSTMTDFELTDYYNDHMSEMTQLISATQHVSAAITMFEKIQSTINLTFSNPAVAAGIPDIPATALVDFLRSASSPSHHRHAQHQRQRQPNRQQSGYKGNKRSRSEEQVWTQLPPAIACQQYLPQPAVKSTMEEDMRDATSKMSDQATPPVDEEGGISRQMAECFNLDSSEV
eukprot:jgi/Botrbrau1/16349/Bobra.178_1s0002.1